MRNGDILGGHNGNTTNGHLVDGFISNGKLETITGWWFGTFFYFPYIGNGNPN